VTGRPDTFHVMPVTQIGLKQVRDEMKWDLFSENCISWLFIFSYTSI